MNKYEQQNKLEGVSKRYRELLSQTARYYILEEQTDEERELFKTNRKKWEKENKDKINLFIKENSQSVAAIASNKINNIMSSNDGLIVMLNTFRDKLNLKKDDLSKKYKDIYANEIGKNILFAASDDENQNRQSKYSTQNASLEYNYDRSNHTKTTSVDLFNSLKNIKEKNNVIVFDLETISGTDENGQNKLGQITDFSFDLADKDNKLKKSNRSIIGSTQEQYDEYINIINKIEKGQGFETEYDKIAFERLKMIGASTIDDTQQDKGIFTFTSFPGKEKVPGLDTKLAKQGAERLLKIGSKQRLADLIDYNGYKVSYWEKELLEALDTITDNGYTVAGHNIIKFDIPIISETLLTKMSSDGAKEYIKQKYPTGFNPKNVFDTLSAERIWGRYYPVRSKQAKAAKEIESGPFSQEALVRSLFENFYEENAAHTSAIDTKAHRALLLESHRYDISEKDQDKGSIVPNDVKNSKTVIDGEKQTLFLAQKGYNPNSFGLLGVTNEIFNGKLHSLNAPLTINLFGYPEKELFAQPGLQAGVAYSVKNIKEINVTEEDKLKLFSVDKNLTGENLYSISFLPELNREVDNNLKALTPITYIGTKQNIESLVNNLILVGQRNNENEEWSMDNVSYSALKDIGTYSVEDGKLILDDDTFIPKKDQNTIENIIDISTHNFLNEHAARARREHSYSKDKKLIEFVDKIDQYVESKKTSSENLTEKDRKQYEAEFIQQEIEKALQIESKASSGKIIEESEYGLIHSILGFNTEKEVNGKKIQQKAIYRNTIDAALQSIDYIRKNKNALKAALSYVENQFDPNNPISGDYDLKQRKYKDAVGLLLDRAVQKNGSKAESKTNSKFFTYVANNKFEINLNGYKKRSFGDNNIIRIDLTETDYRIADKLFEIQGIDPKNISEESKVAELKSFQDFLVSKNIIQKTRLFAHINEDVDNFATSSFMITQQLRQTKALNNKSGIVTDTEHYNVLSYQLKDFGLTQKEIDQTLKTLDKETPKYFNIISSKKYPNANSKTINSAVDDIVNNILFQSLGKTKEEELKEIQSRTGYSFDVANKLQKIRDIKRQEAKEFFTDIFTAVYQAGGSFAYNKKNGNIYIEDPKEKKLKKINNVFKDVVTESGMMYLQIGETQTVAPYGFFQIGKEEDKILSAGTRIGLANASVGYAKSKIAKDALEGRNIVDTVQNIIDNWNATVRQIASNSKEDAQDIKSSTWIDTKPLWNNLYEMYDYGVFDSINIDTSDPNDRGNILKTFLEKRRPYDVEHLDYNVVNALNTIMPSLLESGVINKYLANAQAKAPSYLNTKVIDQSIIEGINVLEKKGDKGIYSLYNNFNALEDIEISSRNIQNQISRVHSYLTDNVQTQIEEGLLEDVVLSNTILSESRSIQEHNKNKLISTSNNSSRYSTGIIGRRMQLTTRDLHTLVAASDSMSELTKTFFETASTHENSALASPEIIAYALSDRDSTQKLSLAKLAEDDGITLNNLENRNKFTPQIILDKDGNISFQYNTGSFIQKGQNMAYIKGWKESQDERIAKYTGILKLGIFSSNSKMLEEGTINTVFNSLTEEEKNEYKNLIELASKTSSKNISGNQIALWNKTNEILTRHNLKAYLYIDQIDMSANTKLALGGAEKVMAETMAPSIGSVDERIKNVITSLIGESSVVLGNTEKDKNKIVSVFGDKHFLSLIPSRQIVDSLLQTDDLSKTDFGIILSGFGDKKYTHEDILKAIQENGFKDAGDFRNAILKEQNSVWKDFVHGLKKINVLKDNESINVVSNTIPEDQKHKNISTVINAYISTRLLDAKDKNPLEIKKEIVSELSKAIPDISLNDKGDIVTLNNDSKDAKHIFILNEVQKAIDDKFRNDNNSYTTDRFFYTDVDNKRTYTQKEYESLDDQLKQSLMKQKVEVSGTLIQGMTNWDQERSRSSNDYVGKKVKITSRNLENIKMHTFDDDMLLLTKEKLVDSLGEKEGNRLYEQLYGGVKNGEYVAGEVIRTLEDNLYMAPGEELLARFGDDGKITRFSANEADNNAAIKNAQKIKTKLLKSGISEEEYNAIINSASSEGARGVSESFVRNTYNLLKFSQAKQFNDGKLNSDINLALKRGFTKVSVKDILTDSNVDEKLDNSVYGKNILLDLHMDNLSPEHQLYKNEFERYIALPYYDVKYMSEDSKVRAEFQQKLSGLTKRIKTFNEEYEKGTQTQENIDNMYAYVQEGIGDIKTLISKELTKKKGIISKASEILLDDAGIFTTQGLHLIGVEDTPFLKNLQFEGINILEQSRKLSGSKGQKGLDLAYAIASKTAYNTFYNDKYLSDITNSLRMDEETAKAFRQNLYGELNTSGTLSVNSRDPQNYTLSTNSNILYFSDTVHGDTLKVSNSLQKAMQNDNDSDKIMFKILKGRADISYTDSEGNVKTKTRDIDYATYNVLKQMDNVNIKLSNQASRLFESAKRWMFVDSSTIYPQFYSDDPNKRFIESDKNSSFELDHLQSEYNVSGDSTGEMSYASSKTYSEKEKAYYNDKYSNMFNKFKTDISQEQLHQYYHSPDNAQRKILRDWIVDTYKDKDDNAYQEAKNILEYRAYRDKEEKYITAVATKSGAGAIDFQVNQMTYYARQSGAYNGIELQDLAQVRSALNEQFLSPKNETGKPDLHYIEKVSDMFNQMRFASRSNNQEMMKNAQENAFNVLSELLAGRYDKELSKLTPIVQRDEKGNPLRDENGNLVMMNKKDRINRALRTFSEMATRVDFSEISDSAFLTGTSNNGLKNEQSVAFFEEADSLIPKTVSRVNTISQNTNQGEIAIALKGAQKAESKVKYERITPDLNKSILFKSKTNEFDLPVSDKIDNSKSVHKPNLNSLIKRFNMNSKGIIAGLGAGILLSGYGSSPSRPAETQAAGANEGYNEQYNQQVPMLSDNNPYTNLNNPPSYTINISGNSNISQEQLSSIVNSAINSQVPSNTSINLQMNTSFADKISQLQINKMIANSFLN